MKSNESYSIVIPAYNVGKYIEDKEHNQMWKVCKNVISLPEGYTKWVIHGDNISVKKGMIK